MSESHVADQLWLYLVKQAAYSTPPARKELLRRMREVLIKDIALCGIPRAPEALIAIGKVLADEDLDQSLSRESWARDTGNRARAMAWLERSYAQNVPAYECSPAIGCLDGGPANGMRLCA